MPNETIHAKNKTENDNYIDKHKEEKVKCCKKNKKKPPMLICEDFHTNIMLKQPIIEN